LCRFFPYFPDKSASYQELQMVVSSSLAGSSAGGGYLRHVLPWPRDFRASRFNSATERKLKHGGSNTLGSVDAGARRPSSDAPRYAGDESPIQIDPRLFQELVDAAPDGMVMLCDGCIEYCNRAFVQLAGLSSQAAALHKNILEFVYRNDHAALMAFLRNDGVRDPRGQATSDCAQVQLLRADGKPLDVELSSAAVSAPAGFGSSMAFLLIRDASRRVADYREAAFNDAREMAAIFCHDLRAPVRAINGFASMVREQLADFPHPDSVASDLGQIVEGSTRLGKMIDGMQTLIQMKRPATNEERLVDTAKLVASILDELDVAHNVALYRLPLYPMVGNPTLLRQAIQNLISNAVKFSRNRPAPMIEVRCEKVRAEVVFSVKDNGVGFSEKQRERLFAPFSRLDTSYGFEGLGAGLSIVSRIADYHGGRVWGEGHEDEGAIFYFAVPLPPAGAFLD
jgi:signal transduction histidine kinase